MNLAVIFPGIGYRVDKPLLYYTKELAWESGYEIKEVLYEIALTGVKGDASKMEQAFHSALKQTEDLLKDVDFAQYDIVLFVSKSLGTAVAAAYASKHELQTYNLFFTPVEATFPLINQRGVVFHGTNDSWARTEVVEKACKEKRLKLYIMENANHSMETGDVIKDLENMKLMMEQSREYIEELARIDLQKFVLEGLESQENEELVDVEIALDELEK